MVVKKPLGIYAAFLEKHSKFYRILLDDCSKLSLHFKLICSAYMLYVQ